MTSRKLWIAVVVTAAVVRLLTLGEYPLNDTTEARYSEIARLMVVTDDWITPQIEPGNPFWAKPPLSIWLTAVSFKLLGFSEFAARLPAFLLTLLTAFMTYRLGRTVYSEQTAVIASAVLLTSVLGFIAAGAVMTDAALLLALTICMLSFSLTIDGRGSNRRYGLFVGLGLGLLAKGPLALVLVGTPIFVWSLWQKDLRWLWQALPWLSGTALTVAIAVPWYVLAEINSPGFLEYFLVGEHWLRFVQSGWSGDLYGHAHARPRGMIWLYGIAAALPWSVYALYVCTRSGNVWARANALAPVSAFLLLWVATPLVFFTFAGNILPAYVLPGLPAFALLIGVGLSKRQPGAAIFGLILPTLFVVAIGFGLVDDIAYRSQRDLVAYHIETTPTEQLYYFHTKPYSASFYSNGEVRLLATKDELENLACVAQGGIVAVRDKHYLNLADDVLNQFTVAGEVHNYVLLKPAAENC